MTQLATVARQHGFRLAVCAQRALVTSEATEARCVDAHRLSQISGRPSTAKLKGNRPECGCYESRDIGDHDTCPHGCVYCYAVQNRDLAVSRYPIPYPNLAQDANLADASQKTKADGNPIALSSSNIAVSTGDEAGTAGGGIISSKIKGKVTWPVASIDVQVEGKGVVRFLDICLHNGNTPNSGAQPATGTPTAAPPSSTQKAQSKKSTCEYCDGEKHSYADRHGTAAGSSTTLAGRILSDSSQHQWYIGERSIAAHHVICTEAVQDEPWPRICQLFGYDINCKSNGVFLPMVMALACQVRAPLHRSKHSRGRGGGLRYPQAVKKRIRRILDEALSGKYCSNPGKLKDDMDKAGIEILGKVSRYQWTLTADGRDYRKGGNGCAGARSVSNKPAMACPRHRAHNLKHQGVPVPPRRGALSIGR